MKDQKGFSLVELLVVVIIIAIIAAIAIPNLLASRRSANEAQATANMRTVNTAEQTYFATTGLQKAYGAYSDLTGDKLLDPSFTDGAVKGAYTYAAITLASPNNDGFCATAKTGDAASKSYATSHPGAVYYVAGTTVPACVAATGVITGTVVGN